jgi:NAD(P)-dependent dehydrogenase (short-subunit alcohol dehydrogenase family)
MRLQGKIAVVSASGRGIGRAIALAMAKEGADLVVNSYQEETTAQTAAEVKAMGRRVLAIPGDVTKMEMIDRVVQDTIKTFGRIDILVNNVGGGTKTPRQPGASLLEKVAAEWDSQYEQNLRASVLMCRAVAPHFMQQKYGKIINISSLAARYPSRISPVSYGSMKAALIRFSQSLADELGPYNVNVNCICPGLVYTPSWERGAKMRIDSNPAWKGMTPREWFLALNDGKFPEIALATPLRREQTMEDIAQAAVFLVSEEARNITGQTMNVDGGRVKN